MLLRWHGWEKGNFLFFSLLPLPLVLLGGLIYLAHGDYERIRAERHRRAELVCLAENVYYEARGEPLSGQYGVAEVTMNRVASPQFPDTVCEVVHERRWDPLRDRFVGAFSWTELQPLPAPVGPAWDRALRVAEEVYDNERPPALDGALYYHATRVEPTWARTKERVARIGRHVFYR
ncbi:MAG TPA: cell wall hydrolase [Gammaproteobacteria bacterium]